MKKSLRVLLFLILVLGGVCFFRDKNSLAKSEIVSLNMNRPYLNYDVDNDGKADRIEARSKNKGSNNILRIILNNKVIYKHKEPEGVPEVSLIRMKKKRTLLYVAHLGEDDSGPREIYLFRGKKWTRLINLNPSKDESVYGRYAGSPDATTASTLTIRYQELSYMIGATEYEITYSFKSDRLVPPTDPVDVYVMKQGSSAYKRNAHLTAKEEMPVYSMAAEPDGGAATGAAVSFGDATVMIDSFAMIRHSERNSNPVGVFGMPVADKGDESDVVAETSSQIATINPGDDVIINRFIRVNSRPWFQVTIGEITGWIPAMKDGVGDDGMGRYFKDLLFYG
ncbi:MAG: hypothetical protein J5819_05245 [Eubacterium sp.]|nr:hypothetical protein [Eubacterium sp.]